MVNTIFYFPVRSTLLSLAILYRCPVVGFLFLSFSSLFPLFHVCVPVFNFLSEPFLVCFLFILLRFCYTFLYFCCCFPVGFAHESSPLPTLQAPRDMCFSRSRASPAGNLDLPKNYQSRMISLFNRHRHCLASKCFNEKRVKFRRHSVIMSNFPG